MVLCSKNEVWERAARMYGRQEKFAKVYIFRGNVCRKTFMLILTERERQKFDLQEKNAVFILGAEKDAAERWA